MKKVDIKHKQKHTKQKSKKQKSKPTPKSQKNQKTQTPLKPYQKICALLLLIIISGFIGWVWEFLLQEFEGGFKHIYIKGGNFLPWINIYAYGAVAVIAITYKIRKHPWLVFIISALVTGTIEFIGGWLAYTLYDGARYWNYAGKWWGIGNIDGFVCPVSVITFGLGSLFFVYVLFPFCLKIAQKTSKQKLIATTTILFVAIITDEFTNLTLKNLNLPTAINFYESLGFKLLHK